MEILPQEHETLVCFRFDLRAGSAPEFQNKLKKCQPPCSVVSTSPLAFDSVNGAAILLAEELGERLDGHACRPGHLAVSQLRTAAQTRLYHRRHEDNTLYSQMS